MPITYACEHCQKRAASMAGWKMISIAYLWDNPAAHLMPPSGRTLEATAPDLLFDSDACRDAWAAAHALPIPTHV